MSNYALAWAAYVFCCFGLGWLAFILSKNKWWRRLIIFLVLVVIIPVQVQERDILNQDAWFVPSVVQSLAMLLLSKPEASYQYLDPVRKISFGLVMLLIFGYSYKFLIRPWRKKRKEKKQISF